LSRLLGGSSLIITKELMGTMWAILCTVLIRLGLA
jgi:hypothetical protein